MKGCVTRWAEEEDDGMVVLFDIGEREEAFDAGNGGFEILVRDGGRGEEEDAEVASGELGACAWVDIGAGGDGYVVGGELVLLQTT